MQQSCCISGRRAQIVFSISGIVMDLAEAASPVALTTLMSSFSGEAM